MIIADVELAPRRRSFVVEKKYLAIPIDNRAQKVDLTLAVDGAAVRRYSTELATNADDVDWYAYFTIDAYDGQPAQLSVSRGTEEGFQLIEQTNSVPGSLSWYSEKLRPQFHFSQAVGWNNDPNGLVHHDDLWHLFFQHNPVGWDWGNMTWGHAVSRDLVHWRQLPNALFPKVTAVGDCFSGGGTVDVKNTAGWKTGDDDVLVVFLTDTGAGESVAYSNDGGKTFTWYEGNPIVKHRGRDPKVIWYAYDQADEPLNDRAAELGGHWVMAVYDEDEEHGQNIAFYTSVDLKQWQEQSHLPGFYECPELFPLPVDGNTDDLRWVVFAADARYALGDFDGRRFTPTHEGKHQLHWGAYYASQTFENAPDGRRIQIGWAKIAAPGMPFNQAFSFPHCLTLRTTPEGVRMFAEPIEEIEQLQRERHATDAQSIAEGESAKLTVSAELLDVRAEFDLGDAKQVGVDIGGNRTIYHVVEQRLGEATLAPHDGRIQVRALVDRNMIETIGNQGRVYITSPRESLGVVHVVEAFAVGGQARLTRLEVYELKSIWSDD